MNVDRKKLGLIFTGLGIVGVGVTATVSAIRSPKFKDILEQEEDSKKGIVKAAIKTHYPTFISGMLTIGCIIFAEGMNLKEIAALSGLVVYLVNQRDNILRAVDETKPKLSAEDVKKLDGQIAATFDEEKEKEIKYLVKAGPSVEETDRGDLLCYEGYSGRWFRSSEEAVRRAIKNLQEHFDKGEYICMNDLYNELGIATTHFGHQWGWVNHPDYYDEAPTIDVTYMGTGEYLMSAVDDWLGIPFGDRIYNDEPILVIDIYTYPMECWMEV